MPTPATARRSRPKFACPVSGFTIDEIEPRLFSFNNPFGACPSCDGLGTKMYMDAELVVPDDGKSLADGAIAPWAQSSSPYYRQTLDSLARHYKVSTRTAFGELPEKVRNAVLFGSGDQPVEMEYDDGLRSYRTSKPFEGVVPNLERRWRETDSAWVREELARYQSVRPCEECDGQRLKPEALAVKIDSLNISEVTEKSISAAVELVLRPERPADPEAAPDRQQNSQGNQRAAGLLYNVGLEYLTLGRASATLSGGESQRIRLASQIGSGPDRGTLCARRAVDRVTPTRQCPTAGDIAAPARPRQYGHRRRARRGSDPQRGLPSGPGSRCRHTADSWSLKARRTK